MSIVHSGSSGLSWAAAVSCVLSAAVTAPAQEPGSETPVYARVEQAEIPLRCFPTAYSPVYEEILAEGEVVIATDESQSGYRAIRLPLGPLGFVHSRFAEIGDDGTVQSKGVRVAFRYRPNSREAPVRFVDEGTEFRLVAQQGEWLQVRYPDQVVWMPEAALVRFPGDQTVDTVVAAWRSHEERQQAQVIEAVARVRAEREAEALLVSQREELDALTQRFRAETARPNDEQDIDTIRGEAAALTAAIAADSALRRDAERLVAAADQQARALEMRRLVAEPMPEPEVTIEPDPVVGDPLGEYATGWLKVSGGLFSARRYTLEKGGQVLLEISCSTGRYNLDVFGEMEVALRGPIDRPDPDSMRRLDVQRIEVLSQPRE